MFFFCSCCCIRRINCNIFSYDYSGYGVSNGKPSEKNLYADIDAAWQALRTRYGISPENIILYGQSIGTVPTVDLASRYEVNLIVSIFWIFRNSIRKSNCERKESNGWTYFICTLQLGWSRCAAFAVDVRNASGVPTDEANLVLRRVSFNW